MTTPLRDWRASCTRALNTAAVCGDCVLRRRRRASGPKYILVCRPPQACLAQSSDKRLLVTESEFGAVIAVMRRRGSTLQSSLRAAWDRRSYGRDGVWPQLSAAAFYGLPGRVVVELAPHTGCPQRRWP